MATFDFAALENIEFDACSDLYRAAPQAVRTAHDIAVVDKASATCLTCRGIEPPIIFRRAVRLGVERATSEAELDEVLSYMREQGSSYAVTVAPESQPGTLSSWLEGRGFTPGYAWMKFGRSCDDAAPQVTSDLEVRVIDSNLGDTFGSIVAEAFELPPSIAPWIGALAGRDNWVCVMAFEDDTPFATGALYVNGAYAWLGFGATAGSHRRKGAQNALLRRRLAEAKARGARVAVTETGERLPGKPSNSYRNILRAGFEEMYLRQNYLSPSTE